VDPLKNSGIVPQTMRIPLLQYYLQFFVRNSSCNAAVCKLCQWQLC